MKNYYVYLRIMQANCEERANRTTDFKLKQFYRNAAKGFAMKADNIQLKDLI